MGEEEELYKTMELVLDEVEKLFPVVKLGRWFAMGEFKKRERDEVLSFFTRVANIGSRAIITDEERELVSSIHQRFVPQSDEEKRIWIGLQEKLDKLGLM